MECGICKLVGCPMHRSDRFADTIGAGCKSRFNDLQILAFPTWVDQTPLTVVITTTGILTPSGSTPCPHTSKITSIFAAI